MRQGCLSYAYGLYAEKETRAAYSRAGDGNALKKLKGKLRCRRGGGYVDVVVLVLYVMLVLALAIRMLPVFVAKQQLDTFVTELVREAKISSRVGLETSQRAAVLRKKTGLDPDITQLTGGRTQLNSEMTVFLILQISIGLFGDFGLFPITLQTQAIGKFGAYWK